MSNQIHLLFTVSFPAPPPEQKHYLIVNEALTDYAHHNSITGGSSEKFLASNGATVGWVRPEPPKPIPPEPLPEPFKTLAQFEVACNSERINALRRELFLCITESRVMPIAVLEELASRTKHAHFIEPGAIDVPVTRKAKK